MTPAPDHVAPRRFGIARRAGRAAPRPGRRSRASARQLHHQPLRRHPCRTRPDPSRRRHRSGGDPDLPGATRVRHRRRRRRLGRRSRGRTRRRLRGLDAVARPGGRRAPRFDDADRGGVVVPARGRRSRDDAGRLRARGRRSMNRWRQAPRSPTPIPPSPIGSDGGRSSSKGRASRSPPTTVTSEPSGVSERADPLSGRPADTRARGQEPRGPGLAWRRHVVQVRDSGREPAAWRRRGRVRELATGRVRRGERCVRQWRPGRGPVPRRSPGGGRLRPRRRHRRGPAVDLPDRGPLADRPVDLAADGGRVGRRPRADARPRQDADGRLPGWHAGHADPCGWARTIGDGVAHPRDPRPRGAHRRCRGDPGARSRRPVGAGRGCGLDRRDRWLDAGRRRPPAMAGTAAADAADHHDHGDDHHDQAPPVAQPRRRSSTATSPRPARRSPGAACSSSDWPAASSRRPARC